MKPVIAYKAFMFLKCIQTHTHTRTHIYIYLYICIYINPHLIYIYIYIYIYIIYHIYIYTNAYLTPVVCVRNVVMENQTGWIENAKCNAQQ